MLIIGSQIEGIASRKDKTIRITIGTQELTPEKAGQLMQMQNDFVYIAIKKDEFKQEEMEILESVNELNEDFAEKKSQSKRIKSCLYKIWVTKNFGYPDFNNFYQHMTERYIERLKVCIDKVIKGEEVNI